MVAALNTMPGSLHLHSMCTRASDLEDVVCTHANDLENVGWTSGLNDVGAYRSYPPSKVLTRCGYGQVRYRYTRMYDNIHDIPVETDGQRVRLKELGVDEMQGFFFSKPLPAVEVQNQLTLGDVSRATPAPERVAV